MLFSVGVNRAEAKVAKKNSGPAEILMNAQIRPFIPDYPSVVQKPQVFSEELTGGYSNDCRNQAYPGKKPCGSPPRLYPPSGPLGRNQRVWQESAGSDCEYHRLYVLVSHPLNPIHEISPITAIIIIVNALEKCYKNVKLGLRSPPAHRLNIGSLR
jgi:hypothetical protein